MSAREKTGILVLAYYRHRDVRRAPKYGRCSLCDSQRPVVINGIASARRYLCRKHAQQWARRHGWDQVDTV